jgi:hypothetical protein
MARLSTMFEPVLPKRLTNVPRLHPQAHGRPSWADGTAVRGAPPRREEVVRPKRTQGKGEYPLLGTLRI